MKTYFATVDGVPQSTYMTVAKNGETTYYTGTCGKEKQAMILDKQGKMHVRVGSRDDPRTIALFKDGERLPLPPKPRMCLRNRD